MAMVRSHHSAFVVLLPCLIIAIASRRDRISAAALSSSSQGPPPRHRGSGHRNRNDDHDRPLLSTTSSRRDALLIGLASSSYAGGGVVAGLVLPSSPASAAPPLLPNSDGSVDLAAFNAARGRATATAGGGGRGGGGTTTTTTTTTIVPVRDPPPLLPIRGGRGGKSTLRIPRVGYSLYKTRPEDVGRCVGLALRCGVRHFDTATQYGSDAEARMAFERYIDGGRKDDGSRMMDETPELLRVLDDADLASRRQAERTMGYRSTTPNIDGSAGRRGRREGLFVSHKLSNDEQSTDPIAVKRRVKEAISRLGVGYLDMVMIHSPLTDAGRRIGTYRALLELRDAGFVRSVGVCNYGIGPLEEVRDLVGSGNVDDLPALNQLELSPFNAHIDVVRYCDSRGISIGCSAWSKLSGVDGPGEGWAVLSDLAKSKGMTKAQLLVRWSLQKGYVCVPRSGSSSKVERVAIAENSYGGVNPAATATDESDNSDATSSRSFVLTDGEMKLLDGLDVGYKAGKLGRRDGWEDGDVVGSDWDPTDIV